MDEIPASITKASKFIGVVVALIVAFWLGIKILGAVFSLVMTITVAVILGIALCFVAIFLVQAILITGHEVRKDLRQ